MQLCIYQRDSRTGDTQVVKSADVVPKNKFLDFLNACYRKVKGQATNERHIDAYRAKHRQFRDEIEKLKETDQRNNEGWESREVYRCKKGFDQLDTASIYQAQQLRDEYGWEIEKIEEKYLPDYFIDFDEQTKKKYKKDIDVYKHLMSNEQLKGNTRDYQKLLDTYRNMESVN